MKSLHLKLIFIALFLAVNLFFVFKISSLYTSKNIFTSEEIEQAVEVINKKGIKIDKEIVIKEKLVPSVIKLDFDSSVSEEIAKRIMQNSYGSFTIPDGFSYSNDRESLSFSTDYRIEYSALTESITNEDIEKILKNVSSVDENGEKITNELTKTFFKDINSDPYTVSLVPQKSVTVDGITYIEALQFVDKYEIETARIIVATRETIPLYISGRLFFAEKYKDYETDFFDSINILFEIEESEKKIQQMELIYSVVFDNKSSVYLTPSYRFTYEDKTKKIYDATSASKHS